jgi:cytidylate kinase
MKIAIAGKQRSGKDTVASMISLLSEGSLTKLPLSYMVYEIANQLFNQKTKNRKLLVDIGDAMRSINENVFVDFTIDQFKKLSIGTGYTEGFIGPDVRWVYIDQSGGSRIHED